MRMHARGNAAARRAIYTRLLRDARAGRVQVRWGVHSRDAADRELMPAALAILAAHGWR